MKDMEYIYFGFAVLIQVCLVYLGYTDSITTTQMVIAEGLVVMLWMLAISCILAGQINDVWERLCENK